MQRKEKWNDLELVSGCLKGRREYQKALYDRFSGKMFALCLRYASDRMQAEDFLQDGFVRVFTKLDQYKADGSLEGWVRRIMVTTALQHLRREKSQAQKVELDAVPDHMQDQAAGAIDQMAAEELLELIAKLPSGYRMIFNLYVLEEYSHKEIADLLGISEGTSKSQLARARTQLQKIIKSNENISYQGTWETMAG